MRAPVDFVVAWHLSPCALRKSTLVSYVPPNDTASVVLRWVRNKVDGLPHRCVPIITTDAYGHIGKEIIDGREVYSEFNAISRWDAEKQNALGHALRVTAEHHHLCPLNTFSLMPDI